MPAYPAEKKGKTTMMNLANKGFATRQIHAGKHENSAGALCTPIYQTSTFEFETVQQGGARFAGQEPGFIYTRLGNPSVQQVEEKLASLEGAEAAIAAASGMGAVATALWSCLSAGSEIVASDTLYGCTFALMNHGLTQFGVKTHFVDFSDLDAVKAAMNEKTKVVYLETPCNPNMKMVDIAAAAKLAHDFNPEIMVIVDNTFCSPNLQQPLSLGADVVIHSATKYLNGHGDVIAGFVVGSSEFITKCRMFGLKDMTGASLSPFDAFLIARGLKTLNIRMERHCENAMKVARFLHDHPAVDKVYYPGLEDFEGYEIAKKQMKMPGGMMAFELKADREAVANALNNLQMCTIAVSLGDAETLIEHPATMTHSTYTAEELKYAGISEGLVRLSVGLEDAEDIIDDLKSVLDTLV